MRATIIAFTFLSLFLGNKTFAQGIPVYDAAGFAQLITQLDQMSKDYQKQLEQLDEAIKQSSAITGSRSMGDLANSDLEKQLRKYLPSTWKETLDIMNATNLPTGAYGTQNLYGELYSEYDPLTGEEALPDNPDGYMAKALDKRTGTTYASMAASQQAYDNISSHMHTYETLLEELNNTQDLKSSVDLQARISAENGFIMSEIIRLQTIQMQQTSANDNEQLMNYRRANTANQYDAGKAKEAVKFK